MWQNEIVHRLCSGMILQFAMRAKERRNASEADPRCRKIVLHFQMFLCMQWQTQDVFTQWCIHERLVT